MRHNGFQSSSVQGCQMAIWIKVDEQHFPVVLIINKVHKVEFEQILKM